MCKFKRESLEDIKYVYSVGRSTHVASPTREWIFAVSQTENVWKHKRFIYTFIVVVACTTVESSESESEKVDDSIKRTGLLALLLL